MRKECLLKLEQMRQLLLVQRGVLEKELVTQQSELDFFESSRDVLISTRKIIRSFLHSATVGPGGELRPGVLAGLAASVKDQGEWDSRFEQATQPGREPSSTSLSLRGVFRAFRKA